jgi:very-short-patch-repair endonuclease
MWSEVAATQPFRRGHAPAWLTEPRIRAALRNGDVVSLRRGVLAGRQWLEITPDRHVVATQAAIAGLRGGSAPYACLGTAAFIHGISRLGRPPERVRVYRERGGPWRDDDVAVLVCTLPPEHVSIVDDIPVTTPARTAVDLGRWVSFRSAVVVMDSALRQCSPAELDAVLVRCQRWPGILKARTAAEFADPRAASPLESISRVVFHESDLPRPELQAILVADDWGSPVTIVDFYWEEFGVVGEADGLLKYDGDDHAGRRALRDEKLRQEELEAMGYIVVRWTWEEIWRRPDWVVARIRRAMAEGARRRTA